MPTQLMLAKVYRPLDAKQLLFLISMYNDLVCLYPYCFFLPASCIVAFIIQSYGTVLSPLPGSTRVFSDESGPVDPDQGNLSRALGSVVGIATLRAEGRVGPQLTSHTFGLLKARHLQGLSAEDAWLSSDEGTEWVLRTVDEFLAVISSEDQEVEVKVKL